MTRAARRATTLLLATLAAVTLSLLLLGSPALAADDAAHEAAEEATGFGTGQWDGMLATAIAGVVVGGLVFAMSSPGDIPRTEAH